MRGLQGVCGVLVARAAAPKSRKQHVDEFFLCKRSLMQIQVVVSYSCYLMDSELKDFFFEECV